MRTLSSCFTLSLLALAVATPALAAPTEATGAEPAAAPQAPAEPAPTPLPAAAPTAAPASTLPAASLAPAPVAPAPAASAPASPGAPAMDEAAVPDDGKLGSHQTHFWLSGGARTTLVPSDGFDLFAGDDVLAQASFAFGRVFFADGPWSLGASLGWDFGSRSSNVRQAATSLQVHRFTLDPEARYHFARRLYAFARVGVGGAILASSLYDPVSGAERSQHPLKFTFDTSVGGAVEVLGQQSGSARGTRGWLVLDAGYLFTSSTELVYESGSGSPVRTEPIALGELALRGVSGRLSVAVTF